MKLTDKLHDYITASFTGLWVKTTEPNDVIEEIAAYCQEKDYRLAIWDSVNGTYRPLEEEQRAMKHNPIQALQWAAEQLTPIAENIDNTGLLVLPNFHHWVSNESEGSRKAIQAMQELCYTGRVSRTFALVLAPIVNIPIELEDWFVVVEHDLPDREELQSIMEGVATEDDERPATDEDLEFVLDAASGLTRTKAQDAFSLCIARTQRVNGRRWIDPAIIAELKSDALKKFGPLRMLRTDATLEKLGGLEGVKDFCLTALTRKKNRSKNTHARGIAALGISGSGKSQFCKALGNATGREVLELSLGRVKSKYVGESTAFLDRALEIADAMQPCILYLDEIEKMMASITSSGSPVGGDMLQIFLSWLNDHETDVFVVCTANDVRPITESHPEFFRDERWDGVFFFDLPNEEAKQTIWEVYKKEFGIDPASPEPDDSLWTGAEIRSCCRKADLLGYSLQEAGKTIVPVLVRSADTIQASRQWANGCALSADHVNEIYTVEQHAPKVLGSKRRSVAGLAKGAKSKKSKK